MTWRVMIPTPVSSGDITASNVDLEPEWVAGTYTLGDQRRVGEVLYEVSAATTTEEPSDAANDWFNAGPINQLAAFDGLAGLDQFRPVETKTTNADTITYTITTTEPISGIAFFGLVAQSIQIVGTQATSGDVADINVDMSDSAEYAGSFYDWLFLPPEPSRKYLNFDLAIPQGSQLGITIENMGGFAEVGTIAFGSTAQQGIVEIEASRRLNSRSFKRTTGTTTSLLRRTPSARVTYPITVQDFAGAEFWRLVEDVDGVAAVFAGPINHPELAVYGFITSAQSIAKGRGISKISVEVESL